MYPFPVIYFEIGFWTNYELNCQCFFFFNNLVKNQMIILLLQSEKVFKMF